MQIIDTTNDRLVGATHELRNNSWEPIIVYIAQPIRTRQEAFRFAAWLTTMADASLPNEPNNSHTFADILSALECS